MDKKEESGQKNGTIKRRKNKFRAGNNRQEEEPFHHKENTTNEDFQVRNTANTVPLWIEMKYKNDFKNIPNKKF